MRKAWRRWRRSERAREKLKGAWLILMFRVIVNDLREQARSYLLTCFKVSAIKNASSSD